MSRIKARILRATIRNTLGMIFLVELLQLVVQNERERQRHVYYFVLPTQPRGTIDDCIIIKDCVMIVSNSPVLSCQGLCPLPTVIRTLPR